MTEWSKKAISRLVSKQTQRIEARMEQEQEHAKFSSILQYKNTEIRTKPYIKKLNQKIDKYNLYVDHLKNLDKENKLAEIINLISDKIFLPGTIDKTMYDVLNKSTISNIRNILRKGSKHDYTNIDDDDMHTILTLMNYIYIYNSDESDRSSNVDNELFLNKKGVSMYLSNNFSYRFDLEKTHNHVLPFTSNYVKYTPSDSLIYDLSNYVRVHFNNDFSLLVKFVSNSNKLKIYDPVIKGSDTFYDIDNSIYVINPNNRAYNERDRTQEFRKYKLEHGYLNNIKYKQKSLPSYYHLYFFDSDNNLIVHNNKCTAYAYFAGGLVLEITLKRFLTEAHNLNNLKDSVDIVKKTFGGTLKSGVTESIIKNAITQKSTLNQTKFFHAYAISSNTFLPVLAVRKHHISVRYSNKELKDMAISGKYLTTYDIPMYENIGDYNPSTLEIKGNDKYPNQIVINYKRVKRLKYNQQKNFHFYYKKKFMKSRGLKRKRRRRRRTFWWETHYDPLDIIKFDEKYDFETEDIQLDITKYFQKFIEDFKKNKKHDYSQPFKIKIKELMEKLISESVIEGKHIGDEFIPGKWYNKLMNIIIYYKTTSTIITSMLDMDEYNRNKWIITKVNRIINKGHTVKNTGLYTPEYITTYYKPFNLTNDNKDIHNIVLNNNETFKKLHKNLLFEIKSDNPKNKVPLFFIDFKAITQNIFEPNVLKRRSIDTNDAQLPPYIVLDVKVDDYTFSTDEQIKKKCEYLGFDIKDETRQELINLLNDYNQNKYNYNFFLYKNLFNKYLKARYVSSIKYGKIQFIKNTAKNYITSISNIRLNYTYIITTYDDSNTVDDWKSIGWTPTITTTTETDAQGVETRKTITTNEPRVGDIFTVNPIDDSRLQTKLSVFEDNDSEVQLYNLKEEVKYNACDYAIDVPEDDNYTKEDTSFRGPYINATTLSYTIHDNIKDIKLSFKLWTKVNIFNILPEFLKYRTLPIRRTDPTDPNSFDKERINESTQDKVRFKITGIRGGTITGLEMLSFGRGYEEDAIITLKSSTSSNARVKVKKRNESGGVLGVTIEDGGTGYVLNQVVTNNRDSTDTRNQIFNEFYYCYTVTDFRIGVEDKKAIELLFSDNIPKIFNVLEIVRTGTTAYDNHVVIRQLEVEKGVGNNIVNSNTIKFETIKPPPWSGNYKPENVVDNSLNSFHTKHGVYGDGIRLRFNQAYNLKDITKIIISSYPEHNNRKRMAGVSLRLKFDNTTIFEHEITKDDVIDNSYPDYFEFSPGINNTPVKVNPSLTRKVVDSRGNPVNTSGTIQYNNLKENQNVINNNISYCISDVKIVLIPYPNIVNINLINQKVYASTVMPTNAVQAHPSYFTYTKRANSDGLKSICRDDNNDIEFCTQGTKENNKHKSYCGAQDEANLCEDFNYEQLGGYEHDYSGKFSKENNDRNKDFIQNIYNKDRCDELQFLADETNIKSATYSYYNPPKNNPTKLRDNIIKYINKYRNFIFKAGVHYSLREFKIPDPAWGRDKNLTVVYINNVGQEVKKTVYETSFIDLSDIKNLTKIDLDQMVVGEEVTHMVARQNEKDYEKYLCNISNDIKDIVSLKFEKQATSSEIINSYPESTERFRKGWLDSDGCWAPYQENDNKEYGITDTSYEGEWYEIDLKYDREITGFEIQGGIDCSESPYIYFTKNSIIDPNNKSKKLGTVTEFEVKFYTDGVDGMKTDIVDLKGDRYVDFTGFKIVEQNSKVEQDMETSGNILKGVTKLYDEDDYCKKLIEIDYSKWSYENLKNEYDNRFIKGKTSSDTKLDLQNLDCEKEENKDVCLTRDKMISFDPNASKNADKEQMISRLEEDDSLLDLINLTDNRFYTITYISDMYNFEIQTDTTKLKKKEKDEYDVIKQKYDDFVDLLDLIGVQDGKMELITKDNNTHINTYTGYTFRFTKPTSEDDINKLNMYKEDIKVLKTNHFCSNNYLNVPLTSIKQNRLYTMDESTKNDLVDLVKKVPKSFEKFWKTYPTLSTLNISEQQLERPSINGSYIKQIIKESNVDLSGFNDIYVTDSDCVLDDEDYKVKYNIVGPVENGIERHIKARYVRFIIKKYEGHPAMRSCVYYNNSNINSFKPNSETQNIIVVFEHEIELEITFKRFEEKDDNDEIKVFFHAIKINKILDKGTKCQDIKDKYSNLDSDLQYTYAKDDIIKSKIIHGFFVHEHVFIKCVHIDDNEVKFKITGVTGGVIGELEMLNFGTGYKIDDIITLKSSTSSNARVKVTKINKSGGGVLEFTLEDGGTGYVLNQEVTDNDKFRFELVHQIIDNVNLTINIENPLLIREQIDVLDDNKNDNISANDVREMIKVSNLNIDISGTDADKKIKDVLKSVNKDTLIKKFNIKHYVEYVKNYNCEFNPLSMKVGGDIDSIEFYNTTLTHPDLDMFNKQLFEHISTLELYENSEKEFYDTQKHIVNKFLEYNSPLHSDDEPILKFSSGSYIFTDEQLRKLEHVTGYKINYKKERDNIYTDLDLLQLNDWNRINDYKGGVFLTLIDTYDTNIQNINLILFLHHFGLLNNNKVYFCRNDPTATKTFLDEVKLFKLLDGIDDGSMITIKKDNVEDFDWKIEFNTKNWDVNNLEKIIKAELIDEIDEVVLNKVNNYKTRFNNIMNTGFKNSIKLTNKDHYYKIKIINDTIQYYNLFNQNYKKWETPIKSRSWSWIDKNDKKINLISVGDKRYNIENFNLNCELPISDDEYIRYKLLNNKQIQTSAQRTLGEIFGIIDDLYSKKELIVIKQEDDLYYFHKEPTSNTNKSRQWYKTTENIIKTCYRRYHTITKDVDTLSFEKPKDSKGDIITDSTPISKHKPKLIKDIDRSSILIPENSKLHIFTFVRIDDTDIPMTLVNYFYEYDQKIMKDTDSKGLPIPAKYSDGNIYTTTKDFLHNSHLSSNFNDDDVTHSNYFIERLQELVTNKFQTNNHIKPRDYDTILNKDCVYTKNIDVTGDIEISPNLFIRVPNMEIIVMEQNDNNEGKLFIFTREYLYEGIYRFEDKLLIDSFTKTTNLLEDDKIPNYTIPSSKLEKDEAPNYKTYTVNQLRAELKARGLLHKFNTTFVKTGDDKEDMIKYLEEDDKYTKITIAFKIILDDETDTIENITQFSEFVDYESDFYNYTRDTKYYTLKTSYNTVSPTVLSETNILELNHDSKTWHKTSTYSDPLRENLKNNDKKKYIFIASKKTKNNESVPDKWILLKYEDLRKPYSGCSGTNNPFCDVVVPVYGSSLPKHSGKTRVKYYGTESTHLNTRIYLDFYSTFIIYDENVVDKENNINIMEGQTVYTLTQEDFDKIFKEGTKATQVDINNTINDIFNESEHSQFKQPYTTNDIEEYDDEIDEEEITEHGDYFITENITYDINYGEEVSFSTLIEMEYKNSPNEEVNDLSFSNFTEGDNRVKELFFNERDKILISNDFSHSTKRINASLYYDKIDTDISMKDIVENTYYIITEINELNTLVHWTNIGWRSDTNERPSVGDTFLSLSPNENSFNYNKAKLEGDKTSKVRRYNYNGYIDSMFLSSTHKQKIYNYYGKSIEDIKPNKYYEISFTGVFDKQDKAQLDICVNKLKALKPDEDVELDFACDDYNEILYESISAELKKDDNKGLKELRKLGFTNKFYEDYSDYEDYFPATFFSKFDDNNKNTIIDNLKQILGEYFNNIKIRETDLFFEETPFTYTFDKKTLEKVEKIEIHGCYEENEEDEKLKLLYTYENGSWTIHDYDMSPFYLPFFTLKNNMKIKITKKDNVVDDYISLNILKNKLDLKSQYHDIVMDNCSYQYWNDKSSNSVYDFPTHIKLSVPNESEDIVFEHHPLHINKYVYVSKPKTNTTYRYILYMYENKEWIVLIDYDNDDNWYQYVDRFSHTYGKANRSDCFTETIKTQSGCREIMRCSNQTILNMKPISKNYPWQIDYKGASVKITLELDYNRIYDIKTTDFSKLDNQQLLLSIVEQMKPIQAQIDVNNSIKEKEYRQDYKLEEKFISDIDDVFIDTIYNLMNVDKLEDLKKDKNIPASTTDKTYSSSLKQKYIWRLDPPKKYDFIKNSYTHIPLETYDKLITILKEYEINTKQSQLTQFYTQLPEEVKSKDGYTYDDSSRIYYRDSEKKDKVTQLELINKLNNYYKFKPEDRNIRFSENFLLKRSSIHTIYLPIGAYKFNTFIDFIKNGKYMVVDENGFREKNIFNDDEYVRLYIKNILEIEIEDGYRIEMYTKDKYFNLDEGLYDKDFMKKIPWFKDFKYKGDKIDGEISIFRNIQKPNYFNFNFNDDLNQSFEFKRGLYWAGSGWQNKQTQLISDSSINTEKVFDNRISIELGEKDTKVYGIELKGYNPVARFKITNGTGNGTITGLGILKHGAGYKIDDIITLKSSTSSNARVKVTKINKSGGGVLEFTLEDGGTGYVLNQEVTDKNKSHIYLPYDVKIDADSGNNKVLSKNYMNTKFKNNKIIYKPYGVDIHSNLAYNIKMKANNQKLEDLTQVIWFDEPIYTNKLTISPVKNSNLNQQSFNVLEIVRTGASAFSDHHVVIRQIEVLKGYLDGVKENIVKDDNTITFESINKLPHASGKYNPINVAIKGTTPQSIFHTSRSSTSGEGIRLRFKTSHTLKDIFKIIISSYPDNNNSKRMAGLTLRLKFNNTTIFEHEITKEDVTGNSFPNYFEFAYGNDNTTKDVANKTIQYNNLKNKFYNKFKFGMKAKVILQNAAYMYKYSDYNELKDVVEHYNQQELYIEPSPVQNFIEKFSHKYSKHDTFIEHQNIRNKELVHNAIVDNLKAHYEDTYKYGELLAKEQIQEFFTNKSDSLMDLEYNHVIENLDSFITPMYGKKYNVKFYDSNKKLIKTIKNYDCEHYQLKNPIMCRFMSVEPVIKETYSLAAAFKKSNQRSENSTRDTPVEESTIVDYSTLTIPMLENECRRRGIRFDPKETKPQLIILLQNNDKVRFSQIDKEENKKKGQSMSNAELAGYAVKWITLDTLCMSVPFFSDSCHGMEKTRWRHEDGTKYSSFDQWFTGRKNESDKFTMAGNWDMAIDIGIAMFIYVKLSVTTTGKNPLACALNSSLFGSVKTEGSIAKIKGRQQIHSKGRVSGVKGGGMFGSSFRSISAQNYAKGMMKRYKNLAGEKSVVEGKTSSTRRGFYQSKINYIEAQQKQYKARKGADMAKIRANEHKKLTEVQKNQIKNIEKAKVDHAKAQDTLQRERHKGNQLGDAKVKQTEASKRQQLRQAKKVNKALGKADKASQTLTNRINELENTNRSNKNPAQAQQLDKYTKESRTHQQNTKNTNNAKVEYRDAKSQHKKNVWKTKNDLGKQSQKIQNRAKSSNKGGNWRAKANTNMAKGYRNAAKFGTKIKHTAKYGKGVTKAAANVARGGYQAVKSLTYGLLKKIFMFIKRLKYTMNFIQGFLNPASAPGAGAAGGANKAANAGAAAKTGLGRFLAMQIVITAVMYVVMLGMMDAFFLQDAKIQATQGFIEAHRNIDMSMVIEKGKEEMVHMNESIPQDMCPLGYDKLYYTTTDRLYTENAYYSNPAYSIYSDAEGTCVCPAEMFENIHLNNSLTYFNNDYIVVKFKLLKQYFNLDVMKPNVYLDLFNNIQEQEYQYRMNHLRHDGQERLIYIHKSEMKKILYFYLKQKIFEYNLIDDYKRDMIVSQSVINKFIFKEPILVSKLFNNEKPSENTNIYYNEYKTTQSNCNEKPELCLINTHHSLFYGKDLRYYYYPKHWMKLPEHLDDVRWRSIRVDGKPTWDKQINDVGEKVYQIPANKIITINMNDIYKLKHLNIPNNATRIIDIQKNSTSIVSLSKSIKAKCLTDKFSPHLSITDYDKNYPFEIGLTLNYYNCDIKGNRTSFIKTEKHIDNINYNWGPYNILNSGRRDRIYLEFEGFIQVPQDIGDYDTINFRVHTDDGIRLKIGDKTVFDEWRGQVDTFTNNIDKMVGGKKYPFKLEWYDGGGGAKIQLQWKYGNNTDFETVPFTAFYQNQRSGRRLNYFPQIRYIRIERLKDTGEWFNTHEIQVWIGHQNIALNSGVKVSSSREYNSSYSATNVVDNKNNTAFQGTKSKGSFVEVELDKNYNFSDLQAIVILIKNYTLRNNKFQIMNGNRDIIYEYEETDTTNYQYYRFDGPSIPKEHLLLSGKQTYGGRAAQDRPRISYILSKYRQKNLMITRKVISFADEYTNYHGTIPSTSDLLSNDESTFNTIRLERVSTGNDNWMLMRKIQIWVKDDKSGNLVNIAQSSFISADGVTSSGDGVQFGDFEKENIIDNKKINMQSGWHSHNQDIGNFVQIKFNKRYKFRDLYSVVVWPLRNPWKYFYIYQERMVGVQVQIKDSDELKYSYTFERDVDFLDEDPNAYRFDGPQIENLEMTERNKFNNQIYTGPDLISGENITANVEEKLKNKIINYLTTDNTDILTNKIDLSTGEIDYNNIKIKKHEKFLIRNKDKFNNKIFSIDSPLTIHGTLTNTSYYKTISNWIRHNYNDYVGDGWILVRRVAPGYGAWNPANDDLRMTESYIYDTEGVEYKPKDVVEEFNIMNNKNSQFTFSRTANDVNLSNFNQYLFASSNEYTTPDGEKLPEKWMVVNKDELFDNNIPKNLNPNVNRNFSNIEGSHTNKFKKYSIRIYNGDTYGTQMCPQSTRTGGGGYPNGAPHHGNHYVHAYQDYAMINSSPSKGPIITYDDNNIYGTGPGQLELNKKENSIMYAEEQSLNKESLNFNYQKYGGREQHWFFSAFGGRDAKWKYNYSPASRTFQPHELNYFNNIYKFGGINVYIRYNSTLK